MAGVEGELDTRQKVYRAVQRCPGCHLRELLKRTGLASLGNLEYHLDHLEQQGLVLTRRDGRYKRYFITRERVPDKGLLALLRQETPRRIAVHLLLHPEATHKELAGQFTISPSTLSFHLKKMVQKGVLERQKEGRTVRYRVKDPEGVGRVIIAHRPTFLDRIVDAFAEVWG